MGSDHGPQKLYHESSVRWEVRHVELVIPRAECRGHARRNAPHPPSNEMFKAPTHLQPIWRWESIRIGVSTTEDHNVIDHGMPSQLDDLVHCVDDPSMLLLSEFGSDLPVGRSSAVPWLMDPCASTISTLTVHVISCPPDKDQGRYLWDALLLARLGNLVHGFPDTCVDGTKAFPPTHFPMDLAHTSTRMGLAYVYKGSLAI